MTHSFELGACPRCQKEVASERLQESIVICNHCGYACEAREERLETVNENAVVKCMAVIAAIIAVGFVHAANWGAHSFSIVPLKAKQYLGFASLEDYGTIAHICTELAKPSCVEDALAGIAASEPANIDHVARLASFQARMNKLQEAAHNYAQYFARGGVSAEAAYHYARVLEQLNRVNEAAQMYEFALLSKTDTLQITVTQAYVRMLINHRRYHEARKLIESVRREGGSSAKYFMAKEYEQTRTAL